MAAIVLDRVLLNFLSVADVESELAERNSKITKVTFAKKDGTLTTRVGLPKAYSRRVDHATASQTSRKRSNAASESLAKAGAVYMDYPKPVGGKTGFRFDLDRVVGIGKVGIHVAESGDVANAVELDYLG